MIFKNLVSAVFLVVISVAGFAQSTFVPKNVGSSVNSFYDEVSPVISADQKTLFFTRVDHPENHLSSKGSASVWYSKWNGEWTAPRRMDSLNIGKHNIVLSITADGSQILLYSDNNLFTSDCVDGTWNTPVKLNVKNTPDAALSADGKYLICAKGKKLYVSEKINGAWSAALEVRGPGINVKTPCLANDNKLLYFTSQRKNRKHDLFRAERIGEGWDAWSNPVALNDTINSPYFETALRTNTNGSFGFFSSTRNPEAKADIYQVKLYEDRPYILVKGKILNAITNRPLKEKQITILINGEPAKSFLFDKDSALYQVNLPFGKKYTISALVDYYTPAVFEVDASTEKEFRVINKDLMEYPLPYVLLKGKLLVKNTGKAIPSSAKPKILIDGEEVDSAFVDTNAGTYALKINHGSSYYVQVSARRFESLPEILNLSEVDEYDEIMLDLQADAEKMAIIVGSIIDKKTGKPLSDLSSVRLIVEGVSSVIMNINEATDQYELRVPLREKHIISAYIPGYCSVYETIDVTNETREIKLHRDLTVVPFEKGQSVRLNNVFFEPGKTILNEASHDELDRLVAFLNAYPDVKIEIGGHTDKASKISTLDMAKEVANYLATKGIAKNRITARGYAATKPVASNNTEEGRGLNRRIEFTIIEK